MLFSINLHAQQYMSKEGYVYFFSESPLENIETGGHVFSLHLSNSRGMNERAFLIDTSGNWLEGDVYFGFNISRVFSW